MPRIDIERFGLGRTTRRNATKIPLGAARESQNLLHERTDEAKRRQAINRTYATRPGSGVNLGIHELIRSDGANYYLTKNGTTLYSFADLDPASTGTSIITSMTASFIPSFATANGFAFLADSGKNYVTNGTTGHELQQAAGSSGAISGASGGTATGNAAGVVYYSYTNVDSVSGAETPPSTAISVSRTADQGVSITNVSLSFTAPYTTVNLYRTKADGSQKYRVITGLTSGSFPYADTSLDTSLTTASTVHGENVITASIEKPDAAKHMCFHRGRLFLASGSLLRWSRPFEPTQFESRTDARTYLGKLDGYDITGLYSFRGSLVILKGASIFVLNGDVDDRGFVFSEAVTGIGCIAPRSIAVDGDRAIYFLSACGVYSFDLANARPVSDDLNDFDDLETDRLGLFCAGIEPCTKRYLLSVTPNGGSANTVTHALNLDSGAWGKDQYSMGVVTPSCWAVMTSAAAQRKLFLGDTSGYTYETATTAGADGVTSGDKSGTVTSAADTTHTTCAAMAARTTGDTLKGLSLTLFRAADASYESVAITSNTATEFTHAAWAGTSPVAGDVVYVGAFEWILHLDRMDLGTGRRKRFDRVEIEFEKTSHSIAVRLGYTLDADAAPTATTSYTMADGYVVRRRIDRRGTGLSIYMASTGVNHDFELLRLSVDAEVLDARLPSRG